MGEKWRILEIRAALLHYNGHRESAAKALGMSRSHLWKLLLQDEERVLELLDHKGESS